MANQANKHPLIVQDWCKNVKMDYIIMNELMYKLKGYQLRYKDRDWVFYTNAAWNKRVDFMNFTLIMMQNIWVVKKFTDGNA